MTVSKIVLRPLQIAQETMFILRLGHSTSLELYNHGQKLLSSNGGNFTLSGHNCKEMMAQCSVFENVLNSRLRTCSDTSDHYLDFKESLMISKRGVAAT